MKLYSRYAHRIGFCFQRRVFIFLSYFIYATSGHAAVVDINYNLTGGTVSYTASGTVTASVASSFGVFVVTGTASGVTNWNIGGSITAHIDDTLKTLSTTENLTATPGGGTIFFVFADNPLNLNGNVRSNPSSINVFSSSSGLVNDTDWALTYDGSLPTGMQLTFAGFPFPTTHEMPYFPMQLALMNEAGQSTASLSTPVGSGVSADFLNTFTTPGCLQSMPLGGCVLSIDSISYDFSGVYLTASSIAATGSNPVLLPSTVPVPAAVWLFLSGLVSLYGLKSNGKGSAFRKHKPPVYNGSTSLICRCFIKRR